jgi:hypothetical protein
LALPVLIQPARSFWAFSVDEKQTAYLRRAFDRQRDEAITFVQQARERITREAAKTGTLQSGGMLSIVQKEYVRAVTEAGDKMARHGFELAGTTSDKVCDEVERGLRMIRDALSNDLRDFFQAQSGWSGQAPIMMLGNDFLNATDKRMSAVVDDLRHGMLGGTKLTKDPLVSVISTISNSPGAIAQTGIGNVQTATAVQTNRIRDELQKFTASPGIQRLEPEAKQSILDVADVLGGELAKPTPDASKLARWGKRLLDIAERLGIAVAASGLSHALFG